MNKIDNSTKCRYGAQTVLIVCGNNEVAVSKDQSDEYVGFGEFEVNTLMMKLVENFL